MSAAGVRVPQISTSAAVASLLFIASCVAAPTPDQMSRTKVETAPADLQLLCASAAAKNSGVDSSKVLPVSSSRVDSKTFQVDLDLSGKKSRCLVDDQGNVQSVQPA
jgi:hypothetical protein